MVGHWRLVEEKRRQGLGAVVDDLWRAVEESVLTLGLAALE